MRAACVRTFIAEVRTLGFQIRDRGARFVHRFAQRFDALVELDHGPVRALDIFEPPQTAAFCAPSNQVASSLSSVTTSSNARTASSRPGAAVAAAVHNTSVSATPAQMSPRGNVTS